MRDGLMGVLDRSMVMAKGRRKPGDARGRFPLRSWWFVQPRGVGRLCSDVRGANSSSITAGVGWRFCRAANGDDDAMGVGQDEIYLEGNVEIGMRQMDSLLLRP